MGAHRLVRDLRPPARQRLDDQRMIIEGAAGFTGRFVDGNDQRGARDQLAQETRDRPVAGELGEQQVELAGTTDQAAPVASRVRRALLRHVTEQPPGVGRRPLTGKPVDHMGLEEAPCLEHLARLLDRRAGDAGAPVGPRLHHVLVGEALQDPPNQRPADTEDLAQRFLAEFGAGRQPLLDDGIVDPGVDDVGGAGHARREVQSAADRRANDSRCGKLLYT